MTGTDPLQRKAYIANLVPDPDMEDLNEQEVVPSTTRRNLGESSFVVSSGSGNTGPSDRPTLSHGQHLTLHDSEEEAPRSTVHQDQMMMMMMNEAEETAPHQFAEVGLTPMDPQTSTTTTNTTSASSNTDHQVLDAVVVPTADEIRRRAQERFEQEVLDSAITINPDDVVLELTKPQRRRFWILLSLGVLTVVLSIVLGVIFGVVAKDGEKVTFDDCEGAIGPLQELTTIGSTVGLGQNDTVPDCDSGTTRTDKAGVWYFLEGDGSYITASTCTNETDFEAQVVVFEGQGCDELSCTVSSYIVSDSCTEQSTVFWEAISGITYFLFVSGKDGQQGNFSLSIERQTRFEAVTSTIFREFDTDPSEIEIRSSAQYQAANWMASEDELVMFPLQSSDEVLQFRQRYALAVLYFSMSGSLLRRNLNFLSPESVCTWRDDDEGEGVTCDDEGVVREFTVVDWRNELSGSLPKELVGLDGLQKIDLQSHNLGPTGSLMALTRLSSLTSLRIRSCGLGEKLPSNVGLLTALTSLELSQDYTLTGSIPAQLETLSNLERLVLQDIYLVGEIPSRLMKLSSLRHLVLSTRYIGGPIPTEIGQLSRLTSLDVGNNNLGLVSRRGIVPTEIGKLSLLEELLLGNAYSGKMSHLSESIPEAVGQLRRLRRLHLDTNLFFGSIPDSYAQLIGLEELLLQNNKLSGTIPTFIASFTNLTEINVDNNDFTRGGSPDDFCLPNLQSSRSLAALGWCNCCNE